MTIDATKVGLGVLAGAATVGAVTLGLDALLVDDDLLRRGAETAAETLATSTDLVEKGVGYYTPPTLIERMGNVISENAGKLGEALGFSDNQIVVQTLAGPALITDIDTLQELLTDKSLSPEVQAKLEGVVHQFIDQAKAAAAGAGQEWTMLGGTTAEKLATAIDKMESLTSRPWFNGVEQIDPASLKDFVHLPLSDGGELHLHPEKFADNFAAFTGGTAAETAALEALKSHVAPMLTTGQTIALGAAGGGVLGAVTGNSDVFSQPRFLVSSPELLDKGMVRLGPNGPLVTMQPQTETPRVPPKREPVTIEAAKRPDGTWQQAVATPAAGNAREF